jgi:hypothetical protein
MKMLSRSIIAPFVTAGLSIGARHALGAGKFEKLGAFEITAEIPE